MKPKLCFIIDDLMLGGAQVHLFNLVKGLRDAGYSDLEVVNMSGGGEISGWLEAAGVPVTNYRMRSIRNPTFFFFDFVRLTSFLMRKRPEIVHTYLDTANVFGVLAAKCARVKRIMTSRRDLGVFRSTRMEKLIGTLSNRVDKVVCVCQAAASESIRRERLSGNNVAVIHNGIDVDRFAAQERTANGEIVFCNVAVANRREKGHEDLLRAFAAVSKTLPTARLMMIGDGPLLPRLKELAKELAIDDRVCFAGQVLDVASALKDVSVFVLPSHSEGISNALLEAMAMGIPAVATDVGGNQEVVTSGISGLLVEPGNPDALANGMLEIVRDRQRLASMGRESFKIASGRFRFDQMIRNYDRLYLANRN